VGDDIATALEEIDVEVVDVRCISRLPGPGRLTVRVVLSDGRSLKVRRLPSARRLLRSAQLVGALADWRLPPPILVKGHVAIEPWIDGVALSELAVTDARIARAADILGRLHISGACGGRRPGAWRPVRPLVRRSVRQLGKLASAQILSPGETSRLVRLLRSWTPGEAATGLVHNDFCAENLVEHPGGHLWLVDNEALSSGFLDLDLFMTWSRWPMPEAAWARFLDRYAVWRDPSSAVKHAPFWGIAAVTKSANTRRARGSAAVEVPLRRLRAILARFSRL
jgi:aminoglycoside phosphotransferase (APT) family kinase protein